ncbi:hypothetical protein MCOL2_04641 [Listeria fleischmannii FSL S10-1203]|uniref:Uncharacterized protein n=1 Tax=Listeria fleischmannii FSL S10-1203 TaxID=1265822 RepID=W7DPA4_9LIST|nr:hypothetical protein MCOL2_04641 [Listeria fleischmannii FSL S10-1203]
MRINRKQIQLIKRQIKHQTKRTARIKGVDKVKRKAPTEITAKVEIEIIKVAEIIIKTAAVKITTNVADLINKIVVVKIRRKKERQIIVQRHRLLQNQKNFQKKLFSVSL